MLAVFNSAFIVEGGPVQYVLFGLSVITLALVLDQLLSVFYTRRLGNDLKNTKRGFLCRIYSDRLRKIMRAMQESKPDNLEPFARDVEKILERHIPIFALVSSISPILGILGTVHGMTVSFHQISLDQTLGFKDISLGISYALYTTAYGLIICAVSLIALSLFGHVAARAKSRIEELILGETQ